MTIVRVNYGEKTLRSEFIDTPKKQNNEGRNEFRTWRVLR